MTNTVRGAVSNSTAITLNGTYGIAGRTNSGDASTGVVTFDGFGVNNSSSNLVQVVTEHATQGQISCQVNQTLSDGQKLTFKGSTKKITFSGFVDVVSHGVTNRTITLLLDNFITPGVPGD